MKQRPTRPCHILTDAGIMNSAVEGFGKEIIDERCFNLNSLAIIPQGGKDVDQDMLGIVFGVNIGKMHTDQRKHVAVQVRGITVEERYKSVLAASCDVG